MQSDDPFILRQLAERYKARCELLEEELDILKEKARQDRGSETNYALKHFFRITPNAARVLNLLMAREVCTHEQLFASLFKHDTDDGEKDPGIIKVYVFYIRKALKPYGLKLENIWGSGYLLAPRTKDKIRELVSEFKDAYYFTQEGTSHETETSETQGDTGETKEFY